MSGKRRRPPEASLAARRFGKFAEAYATAHTFAQADELALLVRLAEPQAGWSVLDVATGAGHTALAFAPRVARVVATDIAAPMLEQGRRLAAERGLANVAFEQAAAEALPYAEGTFDLVTCRIAPHHFASPPLFLAEARRVLRPGAKLLVQDHVLPEDEAAARAIDRFERLRDPSHVRAFSEAEWTRMLGDAGFRPGAVERVLKRHDFAEWTSRQGCSEETVARLVALMREASAAVRDWMQPERWGEEGASFSDHHVILLAEAR
jgi:ubiquinone/menaquinone biosynthesis C-methylase UbiE